MALRMMLVILLGLVWVGWHPTAASAAEGADIPKVIEKAAPSVVAIIGKPTGGENGRGANRFDLAHGTGVIVQSDGLIITNAHVVKNMKSLTVVTYDGKTYSGKTTHFDEDSDLALVKIEATGLTAASFASQSDIHVGEGVVAIGTPISFSLRNTVTMGIVSGVERTVDSKYRLLQTDAAINPGNSGGALVNMKGDVIGINTMKYSAVGVDSLGFAIPVDTVQYVLKQFLAYGKVRHPYLGLELQESWEAVVGLPTQQALEVAYVDPDSPAAKSGIKKGDILAAIESTPVRSLVELNEALKSYLPDQTVKLAMKSGGQDVSREVTLGEETGSQWKQDTDGSYIDADQGKTKIGDSHYGWTLKYPAGLVLSDFSGDNQAVFSDAQGEYMISIQVDGKQKAALSPAGLLRKLKDSELGTVLEKKYVDDDSLPYAKVVGKVEGGAYYQARAYLQQDKLYTVTLYIEKEENAKNKTKLNSYLDLLDSFSPVFDAKDASLKDISSFQDKKTVTSDYGISLILPTEWTAKEWMSGLELMNKDGSRELSVTVTSAASGDTLGDWAGRREKEFRDSYGDAYRKINGIRDTEVGGVPAKENVFSWTMGDKWQTRHVFYVIKDKYKYELIFSYPQDAPLSEIKLLIEDVIGSVKIEKDGMSESLGFIQDEDDLQRGQTVRVFHTKYKYSVAVPEAWYGNDSGYSDSSDTEIFSFTGGRLSIAADPDTGFDAVVKKTEAGYKKSAGADSDYVYTANDLTLFGVPARQYKVTYVTQKIPYSMTETIFSKNGVTYKVTARINDAVRTEANVSALDKAVASMEFEE